MKKYFTPAFIAQAGLIAALYAALTITASLTPVGTFFFGAIQFRLPEALTILPAFTPAAIPGLFLGCLISNIVGTAAGVAFGLPDIIFGSLATLAAALLTRKIKKPWLMPLPPVVVNAIVVGIILTKMLGEYSLWFNILTVGIGQAVVCYGLGLPLYWLLNKRKGIFRLP